MYAALTRAFPALAAMALLLGVAPAAAAAAGQIHDPVPIRPNGYFKGVINGAPPGQVVIKVACPVGAKYGKALGHQPIEVEPVKAPTSTSDVGYTGKKGRRITAAYNVSNTLQVVIGNFTSYYVTSNFPTKISVPCSGAGTVDFTPSPGSGTARSAVLQVTFGNVTTGSPARTH